MAISQFCSYLYKAMDKFKDLQKAVERDSLIVKVTGHVNNNNTTPTLLTGIWFDFERSI